MLYIDASRYANTENRTGVENYSYHLINELVKQMGKEVTLLTPRPLPLDAAQRIIPFPRMWTLVRLSWEVLRDKRITNLFVPSHVLPLIHPKRSVITIHDVVFKYSPESYSPLSRLYLDWATRFAVKHAAKIITPSQATKNDLVKFYKANPEKIHVIPLGIEQNPPVPNQKETETLFGRLDLQPKKYFLFLGRIEYKKNTDTLIRAFSEFVKKNDEIKLVLAGFTGFGGKKILQAIPAELQNRIICTGYISESDKTVLLNNAMVFIFPSRFEGFGLPILEAMRHGIPVIASDIPSSREVAGDCALYFKKQDSGALARHMEQVTQSPESFLGLTEKGRQRILNFTWHNCAKNVLTLLRQQ